MALKAVFFDLGDTLWHFPKMPPRELIRGETMRRVGGLVESWGFDMREGDRRFLGRDIRLAVEEETHRAFHGDCVDLGYPELCRRIARQHEMEITPEQGAELWEAWNLGGAFLGRELFPDVLETLRWLRERGFRLGAITNRGYSGPRFHEEVRDLGLAEFFEVMVISCDVGYMKPHPRIYEAAFERMRVEGDESVMVGDNARADVEGAKTMGMKAILRLARVKEPVEATEDEPELGGPVQPDYVIKEISEMKDLPIFSDQA